MFPELRAERLKEIAVRVENEFAGDLRAGLVGPIRSSAQERLRVFLRIADPGADRILLVRGNLLRSRLSPRIVCTHLMRILRAKESRNLLSHLSGSPARYRLRTAGEV